MTEDRRYYCTDCREFRQCRSSGNDIVCNACNFIIATFETEHPAIDPTSEPPSWVFIEGKLYVRFDSEPAIGLLARLNYISKKADVTITQAAWALGWKHHHGNVPYPGEEGDYE